MGPRITHNAISTYQCGRTHPLEGGRGGGEEHLHHHCAVFSEVVSAFHPETISTSTVASLLILRLCICNKKYTLKIDQLPYCIAKELRLFQKIDFECNLFFIFNCIIFKVEFSFILHRLDAKLSWNCLLYEQTILVS